jgi:D-3-phosphoglycerate dehydrogenase
MPSSVSSSKGSIRTLLLEGVNDSAVELFVSSNFSNIERLPKALDADGLLQAIRGVDLLGIRSRTQLTHAALAAADRLVAVGCFSVGTNQVDLGAARQRGIPVFNAPFSNTRSVAELVIGEIVMLLRRIFPRSSAAHKGGWDKSATDSHEVRGRTLGIVGYGNIGSQLSTLAEGMGMKVIYYDHTDRLRHGNTEPVESLQNLLAQSDIVSLHVPETPATHGMIGEAELRSSTSTRCRGRFARAIWREPPSMSFRSSRRQIRTASRVPCRAWKTSSSHLTSAVRPNRRKIGSAEKWPAR